MKNWEENVFGTIPVGPDEADLVGAYLNATDFAPGSRRGFGFDLRKLAAWFVEANKGPFRVVQVTTRDISDCREFLRRERRLAVATINRCLVMVRGYFEWLAEHGHISANPAKKVKELKRAQLVPKGLDGPQVRRLLRELELRHDIRANAVFHLMLYTGARVGDVVNLELSDLLLNDRSGFVVFRFGKGNKERSVPLPLLPRRAIEAYLQERPPVSTRKVFLGERGGGARNAASGRCATNTRRFAAFTSGRICADIPWRTDSLRRIPVI